MLSESGSFEIKPKLEEACQQDYNIAFDNWINIVCNAGYEKRSVGEVSPETQEALDTHQQTFLSARDKLSSFITSNIISN